MIEEKKKLPVIPMEVAKLNYATIQALQNKLQEYEAFHGFLLTEKGILVDEFLTEFLEKKTDEGIGQ